MSEVSLQTTLVVNSDVLFRDLDGEAVLLHLESGKYYGLDEVGTRIWHLLAEHASVSAVFDRLLEEYEVEPGTLERDLCALVGDLVRQDLLRVDMAATSTG